jgi:hypothetical protein
MQRKQRPPPTGGRGRKKNAVLNKKIKFELIEIILRLH